MANVSEGNSPSLHIVLERIEPARNIARYYVLSIEPTLNRPARARTSGENLFVILLIMAPPSQSWGLRKARGGSGRARIKDLTP